MKAATTQGSGFFLRLMKRNSIGQSADDTKHGGLYYKEAYAAGNARPVPLNKVLDRIPLYLVVSHGFENVGQG